MGSTVPGRVAVLGGCGAATESARERSGLLDSEHLGKRLEVFE